MQSKLETTLAQLVAIPSVTADSEACHAAIEYVREAIEPLGLFIHLETNTPNPWLLATTKDTKEPDILLASHLDVVPAEPELFTMHHEGEKLVGRGTYDMKLAATCYVEFAKAHAEKLRDMDIGFLFTTDEELGGACMIPILEMGLRPKVVFIPDGGDDWYVEERAKGLYGVELIAKGKTAHGSRPWEGDNAIHQLMDVLAKLRHAFPAEDPMSSTLAVNELRGGATINQVADSASAKLDFRSFDKHDLALFRSMVERLAAIHNLEHHVAQEGSPLLFDKNNPYVQSFLTTLQNITGEQPRYHDSFGASDARYFAQYDIPCIVLEPHGGGRHGPDEWLLRDDLPRYYTLIEQWILADQSGTDSSVSS